MQGLSTKFCMQPQKQLNSFAEISRVGVSGLGLLRAVSSKYLIPRHPSAGVRITVSIGQHAWYEKKGGLCMTFAGSYQKFRHPTAFPEDGGEPGDQSWPRPGIPFSTERPEGCGSSGCGCCRGLAERALHCRTVPGTPASIAALQCQ